MPWQQLVMDIEPEDSERLEDCLLGAGAVAVSLEDAGDQPCSSRRRAPRRSGTGCA